MQGDTIFRIMKDWKSTAAGVLSFLITTLTVISAVLSGNDLSAGGGISTLHTPVRIVIGVNITLALCRAWVGIITKDAGQTPALPPGASQPVLVPSHEVPDDPNAIPTQKLP